MAEPFRLNGKMKPFMLNRACLEQTEKEEKNMTDDEDEKDCDGFTVSHRYDDYAKREETRYAETEMTDWSMTPQASCIVETSMEVLLPTECADKFLGYFSGEGLCFGGAYAEDGDVERTDGEKGWTDLDIFCQCDGNIKRSFGDDCRSVFGKEAISLREAIEACHVKCLAVKSVCPDDGFEESILFENGVLTYKTHEYFPEPKDVIDFNPQNPENSMDV